MKAFFTIVGLSIVLLMTAVPEGVMAAAAQENPATVTSQATSKKPEAAKKAAPVKKKAAPIKKRPPIASKSKPASEVVKTKLPPVSLDLSLPQHMVEQLKPSGTVTLPKHDGILPQMFGDKTSQFQLNGRLISNEMQLQLRNEERHDVEGAALEFQFKQ